MNDFRYRPKDKYIQQADWQKLYVLTEHWKSDLLFYTDDLRFLHHLIDKYFLWISKKENIDMVQEIEVNLLKIDKQCALLLQRVDSHLHHLSELIDNPFVYVSDKFRDEHESLEDDLAQFVKDFRDNRKGIFKITERIVKGEELEQQLSSVTH
tara:strand:+ start:29027 stop:29485 length:459 start_codon:yes stop_codon:yes gene_type:complete